MAIAATGAVFRRLAVRSAAECCAGHSADSHAAAAGGAAPAGRRGGFAWVGYAGTRRGALEDMAQPGWNLHPLKGAEAGRWSVWVSGNWRLTFAFEGGHAIEVDDVDYH